MYARRARFTNFANQVQAQIRTFGPSRAILPLAADAVVPSGAIAERIGVKADLTKRPITAYAKCPGTFGELLQGKINDQPFLITLPIKRYATATLIPAPTFDTPTYMVKTRAAVNAAAELLGTQPTGRLQMHSDLPVGKGLASSSADIVAACAAFLAKSGLSSYNIAELISRAARKVEPTDGIMYPGIVAYAQHDCVLLESIGSCNFEIIGCVLPGTVDTVAYNSAMIHYCPSDLSNLKVAYQLAREGVRNRDIAAIGQAATISAKINQRHLVKPHFDDLLNLQTQSGAHGVVVAHSGTAVGFIIDQSTTPTQRKQIAQGFITLYGQAPELFKTEMAGPTVNVMQTARRA